MNISRQKYSESYPTAYDDFGEAVHVYTLNFDYYLETGGHARSDQFVCLNNRLLDTDEGHCNALAESLRNYGYNYARRMTTV